MKKLSKIAAGTFEPSFGADLDEGDSIIQKRAVLIGACHTVGHFFKLVVFKYF